MDHVVRFLSRVLVGTLAALVASLGLLVVTPAPAQAAESRVVCNTPWVRIRAQATTRSAELGRLTRGTTVTGTLQGSWFRLSDGRHVAASYTCAASASAASASSASASATTQTFEVCRTPWVRVRAQATTRSAELRRLTRDTVVTGRVEGSWLRLDGGGWVAASYACAAPSGASTTTGASSSSAAAATALLQPTGTLGSPTGAFGQRYHPILRVWRLHNGIDLGNRAGEPVVAAEAGVVTTVTRDSSAGLYVKIDHGTVAGTARVGTSYLHLDSATVSPGQTVARGQLIGRVGRSGLVTTPHLHFSVTESGTPVNPEKYLGPLSALRA